MMPFLLPADCSDRKLLPHVYPESWTNPVPSGKYNLVVIGAGTAGLVTAAGAAGLGAKVVLIDGGDCLNRGCVPSKAFINSIANCIHPYPTQGESVRKVGDLCNNTRLTPRIAAIMKKLIAWQR